MTKRSIIFALSLMLTICATFVFNLGLTTATSAESSAFVLAATELKKDDDGTYNIGTADELFAFAELFKSVAEADKSAGSTRTAFRAKLTANIELNVGVTFNYDHATGLVSVKKGDKEYKMGTGIKDTELGVFHPTYNGLCTKEYWNADTTTDEDRTKLLQNINASVEALGLRKWLPIGTEELPYIGFFDGQGFTVNGLYINDDTVKYAGLFGVIGNYNMIPGEYDYGAVKNVNIGKTSLVVGYNSSAKGATAAVVGRTNNDKVTACNNYAIVVGKGNYASYSGSSSSVASVYGHVGGIAGLISGKVEKCVNYGTVVSKESAGGIVGNVMGTQYDRGSVHYCTNYGKVYADTAYGNGRAGGIVVNAGGAKYANDYADTINACTNYGEVEASFAGGVIQRGARSVTVQYCANRGKVSATSSVGGVIDSMDYDYITVKGCYNAGTVNLLPVSEDATDFLRLAYPIAARIYTYRDGKAMGHSVEKCYNDKTVCPSKDDALFGEKIVATKSYSVTTEIFASGEAAYMMGSYNKSGWRQNLPLPKEDGKTPETYPTTDGTRTVDKQTCYCCHTDATNREAHKTSSYTNGGNDVTAEHQPNENGICSHCGKDVRLPIFVPDVLPEAKVGQYYSAMISVSDDTPTANGNISAVVSETDETTYTFTNGLNGQSNYSRSNGYYYYISGTPTEAGTLTFTLIVSNENGTTKKTFSLKINEADPLEITTESKLDNATVGSGYYRTLLCSTDFEKTWTLAEGSVLPDGLTLDNDGTISGTPTTDGKYTFTVIVSVGSQTAQKTFTIIVFGEGGCTHADMTRVPGKKATCRQDGVADYYHCNICECDFADEYGKNDIFNKNDLVIASMHSDKDNDGKCDLCKKNMPIFRKVNKTSEIVYGGTYVLVTKIGGKFYVLVAPEKNEYGRAYSETMTLKEIADANGDFAFNLLESKGALMIKTEFAAQNGNLDAGTARYGLSSICDSVRYGLSSDDGANFYMYKNEPAKYGYRITLNDAGETLIGSVYQEWWNNPASAGDGLLRAFDMTYGGKNTKFMSFFTKSYYNGNKAKYEGAEIADYPIYIYRMTDVGQTKTGVTFATNDGNSSVDNGDKLPDVAELSNVGGIAEAVDEQYVASVIAQNVSGATNVQATFYAEIKATDLEKSDDGKTAVSVKYSVTPKIAVSDDGGNIIYQEIVSDNNFNGAPITVTLYAGGVSPAQIIHYKEDGTKEYFYPVGSEKARNGAKTFAYEEGFVTFVIDSFSEIEILATAKAEQPGGSGEGEEPPEPADDKKLKGGAIAGIVIGCVVLCGLCVFVAVWLVKKKRN